MADKLHIGDISNLIGTPASTLRFYETHEIVKPVKDSENNYRVYTPEESCRLLIARLLRSFGLPLETVTPMVSHNDSAANLDLLAGQSNDLQEEIGRLSMLKKEIDSYRSELLRARRLLESVEIGMRPGLYRVANIVGGELAIRQDVTRVVRRWMRYLPQVHYSLLLKAVDTAHGEGAKGDWGFSITQDLGEPLGEKGNPPVIFFSPCECLFTALMISSAEKVMECELEVLRRRLSSNHVRASGPILGRFLSLDYQSEKPRYLYLFSVPIKK
ncbi:helix-turn-helix domain-containing protein [Sediminispirochaeta bajacaliforniensis]|uniref:helix-turn-helix domain-containing protein n=1 Tax=Sediminispirochaeta bajacaliforniensis TaxID=148 RepID=UPI00037D8B84|nr:MerR family transcriptional regulator [Sediminispirochaeta bajacaliforniensis]